jgi:hypothetical protein
MCPFCDAARAVRIILCYLPRLDRAEKDGGLHFLVTLTWPPPSFPGDAEPGCERGASRPARSPADEIAALRANVAVGLRALRLLMHRKKVRGTGPFRFVLGLIASVEVARSGRDWHPHLHCIVTLPPGQRVSVVELRREWEKLTGGRQLRIDPLTGRKGLLEAFKYSVKPADVKNGKIDSEAIWWRFLAYQGLRGRRLLRTFGIYHGQDEEPDPELSDLHDAADVLDFLATWCEDLDHYEVRELVDDGYSEDRARPRQQ